MDTLIAYDVKSKPAEKDTEVKSGMKELKYLDYFTSGKGKEEVTYYLPNTTLWKKNTTPEQAEKDLLQVAIDCKATIERLIAVEFTNEWKAIIGKSYAGE